MGEKKYYLYRHIRIDKNEPFYVGIGTKRKNQEHTFKAKFKRAFAPHNENNIWTKIINKTKYKVEILLESSNYNFIKNKEIEFIKLYGRKNLKKGTLANMTDGGEGSLGKICSNKLRRIRSELMKKRHKNMTSTQRIKNSEQGRKQALLSIKLKGKKKGYKMKNPNTPHSLVTINIETGIFYNSIRDAYNSTSLKITENHFRAALTGKYKNKTNFKIVK